jgi:hypothetical protein
MSALSSCFISDYLYKQNSNDEFILCIEQGNHVLEAYYQIVDLIIAQNKQFKKIARRSVEFRVIGLSKPINYLQSIFYYRSISKSIAAELDIDLLDKECVIWAPTTSRLWQFFKKNSKLNIIEHGLGEYVSARQMKKKTWKGTVSDWLGNLLGYPTLSSYKSIWLCSNAVIIQPTEKIVQINFSKEFTAYVDGFWQAYKILFPIAVDELQLVISRIDRHVGPVYLYLPSNEIRSDKQTEFIRAQMEFLKIGSNALFIVKNHPIDIKQEYRSLLEPYGNCINIQNENNCYTPVEFLAEILGVKNIMGSASSALFYLKSWSPAVNTHIYNDYDLNMLTDECKQLKTQLDLSGLLSKMSK